MILEMVPNFSKYWYFIRDVRFHPRNLYGYVYNNPVSDDQQWEYMKGHHMNYWVCIADGEPAGFVGIIEGDLRIGVHPNYQRKGIGTFMMRQFIKRRTENFTVRVKVNNEISLAFFRGLEYVPEFVLLNKKGSDVIQEH